MTSWEYIFTGIQLTIIIQLILVGFLNIYQKQTQYILLGFFCLLTANSIIFYTSVSELKQNTFLYFFIGGSKNQFYGPLLFLYLKSINTKRMSKQAMAHLILPLAFYLLSLYKYYYISEEYIEILLTYLDLITFCVFTILYFIFGLSEYKKNLKIKLKEKSKIRYLFFYYASNLYLLSSVIMLITYYIIFDWGNGFYNFISKYNSASIHDYVSIPFFLAFCLILIVYGFTELKWIKALIPNKVIFNEKELIYNSKDLEFQINLLIKNEHIYKDSNLNLDLFAQKAGIKQSIIRAFLKENKNKNFSDFINSYRIEHFKNSLMNENYKNYDIYGIAKESGFQSRASFYRAFKKNEGITPGEYKKSKKN